MPPALRDLDTEALAKELARLRTKRKELEAEIKELNAKRRAHVQAAMKKQGLTDKLALDRALRDTVRRQAAEGGFVFPK